MNEKSCKNCYRLFFSYRKEAQFCSYKCSMDFRKGKKKPPFSKKWRKKLGDVQRGKKKPPRTLEHKINLSRSQKLHSSFLGKKGPLHPRWKGGKSSPLTKLRGTREYKLWRKSILDRDDHKCIWCFSDKNLHVDHIKSFALFPEFRFAIDNGRTLCKKCHLTTENYGGRYKNLV